jgi:hypothetical protein
MEIIQALAAFFVFFAVASALIQVLFSYSLQVIAEKNELPSFASFIAWIPLLQIYPMIKVGGGDFKKFVLGGIGGVVGIAIIAGGAAAAGFGGIGTGLAVAVFSIVVVVYMARIAMGTAERRGLSKWIGLLTFVPLANFFVYPYIAFHDGFRSPSKLGLVIGLLLAFGPLPSQIALVEQMSQGAQEVAETDMGDGVTFGQALGGLGAAMEIGAQLAMLDGMDPGDPDQASMMQQAVIEIRQKLEAKRAVLGDEAANEMEGLLQGHELRLANRGTPAPTPQTFAFQETPPNRPPARPSPPLTAGIARDGDNGFAVPTAPACPPGTARRGGAPPDNSREWCEKVGVDAGIKHGWMTEYHASGPPAVAGEYRDGLRIGVWTRYYDSGTKRVQAEFEDGLQHGVLISWNPDGSKAYEKYFAQGAPASR